MKFIKEKLPVILSIILFVTFCVVGVYYLENGKSYYYSQIDNTKIKEITGSDMKYEYTLECYNKNGKKKTLKFKTFKELKEDAFLELEVLPISGVHKWQELKYDELPKKVQDKYNKAK